MDSDTDRTLDDVTEGERTVDDGTAEAMMVDSERRDADATQDDEEQRVVPDDDPYAIPLSPLPVNMPASPADHGAHPAADDAQNETEPPTTARRLTGFMQFNRQYRADHKGELKGKSLKESSKIVSAAWHALPEEERTAMKEQAKQVSQAHAGATQLEKKDSGSSLPVGSILPVSRVRKVITLDPDVHAVSKEATLMITASAELFCASLAKTAMRLSSSKRTLQVRDVLQAIRTERTLKFLAGAFNKNNEADANRSTSGTKRTRASNASEDNRQAHKTSKITSFFKGTSVTGYSVSPCGAISTCSWQLWSRQCINFGLFGFGGNVE